MDKPANIEQVTIYALGGGERATVIPNSGSLYAAELMKNEYVRLKFSLAEPVLFRIGDWCEFDFGRFELTEDYRPSYNKSGGWTYEIEFKAQYWKWANKILYYDRQHALECSFSLTHDIQHHAAIVLSNLSALGYKFGAQDYTAVVGSEVTTELRLVTYENISIIEALNAIASAFDCEWWVADAVIHFGKCELGTEVELAEGDEVIGMSASSSSEAYASRIIAFGSTRNLTKSYRPDSEEVVIGSVREKRLMLPAGTPYIDTAENLPTEQAVERVYVFDDIYPRRVGTITEVSTKTYTDEDTSTGEYTDRNAYRFQDTGIKFSTDYLLKDSTDALRIVFQSGALSGMSFDVSFNPDGLSEKDGSGAWNEDAQVYEIIRNDTYGINMPNDTLKPAVGDKYVLYNFDISYLSDGGDNYITRAEQELKEAAEKQAEKLKTDTKSYTCPVDIVRYYGYTKDEDGKLSHSAADELDFRIGQKIKLVNPAFFAGGRSSRVYGFEKYLDGSKVTYTVSDNSQYSRLNALQSSIESLAYNGNSYNSIAASASGGSNIYVISLHDTTRATERNVFSALRSEAQFANKEQAYADFLRKNQDDTAKGKITFEGGAEATELAVTTLATILREYVGKIGSEQFADGLLGSGWQIWQDNDGVSAMTLDKLTVRQTMTVLELLIAKVRSVGGQIVVSAANGKIKAVDGSTVTLEEGAGLWAVGDWARCATYTGGNIKSYWVRVTAVSGDTLTLDTSGLAKGTVAVGDELVLLGNDTDTKRQNAVVISATEDGQPRVDVLDGIKSPSLNGCLRARLGNLDGITDGAFPADAQPSGNGLYAGNAFLRGTFVLADGSDVKQLFELIDGRLNSVISDDWEGKNLLANGWLLNGLLGWSDRQTTATPMWGGTAMAMHGGVLTAYGWPVVCGKAGNPPKWELLTEDGMPYIHELESGDGFSVATDYVTQPTAASRLVLKLLWRDQLGNADADVDVEVVGKNADGKTVEWMSRKQTDGTTDWAWWTATTDEEFASIDYVVINAEYPIDIARVSLTEERLNSSQIEQTANRISLSVTEKNNDKLKKAGIDIDAQSITLSAETTMIKDADGNDVAVFENGKIKTAFLDLGTLEISSEDIPMLGEVITQVRREPVEGQFTELNVTGTKETSLDVDLFKETFTAPAGGWKGYKVYFQCKPTLDSRLSLVSEEVTVDYDEKISDEAWKVIEGKACDREGNYNWSFTAAKEIKSLTIHYRAVVKKTSTSQAQVYVHAQLDIRGFQGGDTLALVPTTTTKTPITKTMVGANGFMTAWMSNFIFHIQSNDKTYTDEDGKETAQPAGCTIMAGQYGWRVSASGGIELTENQGLSWTKA